MSSETPSALAARLDDHVAALPLDEVSAGICGDALRSLAARADVIAARDAGDGVAALAAACAACLRGLADGSIEPGEAWPTVVAGVHTLRQALTAGLRGAAIAAARYELETLLPVPDVVTLSRGPRPRT